jgi:hypothetical protein
MATSKNYVHTSQSLKAQDGAFENYHYQLEDGEKYKLSEGEMYWMSYIRDKYAIYNHLIWNMEGNIYTVDLVGMSEALVADGCECKAPCLSGESALQAIFFYSSLGEQS